MGLIEETFQWPLDHFSISQMMPSKIPEIVTIDDKKLNQDIKECAKELRAAQELLNNATLTVTNAPQSPTVHDSRPRLSDVQTQQLGRVYADNQLIQILGDDTCPIRRVSTGDSCQPSEATAVKTTWKMSLHTVLIQEDHGTKSRK